MSMNNNKPRGSKALAEDLEVTASARRLSSVKERVAAAMQVKEEKKLAEIREKRISEQPPPGVKPVVLAVDSSDSDSSDTDA